jgi:tRNA-(ms[2]io[6]A)-hydroxylase
MLDTIKAFLGSETTQAWVEAALLNQDILLIDHKNCEYKAAQTALNLMAKYQAKEALINALSRLAREELVHYEQVLKIIKRRNIALMPLSASRYAAGLRMLVRRHEPFMITDMMLIGAFIEARSCERFAALVPHLDDELAKFYAGLLASEGRHYQGYLKLAYLYGDSADIDGRLKVFRDAENALITDPDPEFRFHSGVPA